MLRKTAIIAALGAGIAVPAWALDVERSVTIDADAGEVWALIGPFCAIQAWHPAITNCTEETAADGKTRRRLGVEGGGEIYEELVSRDEDERQYRYAILDPGPLPVRNYLSTLTVDAAEGGARIVWKSTFDAAEGVEDAAAEAAIGGVYDAGLAGIEKMAGGG